MPNRLQVPTLFEHVPGAVWSVDREAILVDETGKTWFDLRFHQNPDIVATPDTGSDLVRIIFFEEGAVLDLVPFDGEEESQAIKTPFLTIRDPFSESVGYSENDFERVIAIITDIETLCELAAIFELQFQKTLEGTPITESATPQDTVQ